MLIHVRKHRQSAHTLERAIEREDLAFWNVCSNTSSEMSPGASGEVAAGDLARHDADAHVGLARRHRWRVEGRAGHVVAPLALDAAIIMCLVSEGSVSSALPNFFIAVSAVRVS